MAEIGALAVRITGDVSDFVQKFDRADKAMEKFSNKLDRRLLQPLAKVGAAAAAAAAGIVLFAKRAADMADELGKLSQKVGVSVESLSALKHAAALSDVSLEQLSTGLRQLAKNMADTQANTGEAKQAFLALGMSVVDSQGRLNGTEQQLLEIAERFSKMEDGAGKTALAMRIFGRAGADLIPMLNEGKAGLEAMRKEAERLGIVIDSEAARAAQDFNDSITRLTGAADGLQIQLAGPLVRGLGDTAKAFLEAAQRGDDFFSVLSQGTAVAIWGNDLQRWKKEMMEAGEALLKVQNKLDAKNQRLRQAPGSTFWQIEVRDAKAAVAAATAEIERLKAIQPILAPDPPEKKGDGKPKGAAPSLVNPEVERAAAELVVKQWEWWQGEEERIRVEASDALATYQTEKLDKEREHQQLMLDERSKANDYFIEEEYRRGQEEVEIARQIAEGKKAQQDKELQARRTFLDNLAGLMNSSSKKAFEFGKKVALAQAAYTAAKAVVSAWDAGMSTGGPWAPVVAAAYAGAAAVNGANLINNIRSQQFGGGGGTPIAPSQGSSGVSPVGAGGAGPQQARGPDNVIHLYGESFSPKQLREMFDRLNEGRRDGGRFVLA